MERLVTCLFFFVCFSATAQTKTTAASLQPISLRLMDVAIIQKKPTVTTTNTAVAKEETFSIQSTEKWLVQSRKTTLSQKNFFFFSTTKITPAKFDKTLVITEIHTFSKP